MKQDAEGSTGSIGKTANQKIGLTRNSLRKSARMRRVEEDVTVGRLRDGRSGILILKDRFALDQPGDAEGKQRGRLEENAGSHMREHIRHME